MTGISSIMHSGGNNNIQNTVQRAWDSILYIKHSAYLLNHSQRRIQAT